MQGRLAVASNETFYCSLSYQGQSAACVYKPVAGERPLWDFPAGTLAGGRSPPIRCAARQAGI